MAAAQKSFQTDPSQIDLDLAGDESAAIARDKRAGICVLLYVGADGAWQEHAKFKGVATNEQLKTPLKSAGTVQEMATRSDVRLLADKMCK